jgi:DUF4097 and DUF4098 domain-containing protein YvlB
MFKNRGIILVLAVLLLCLNQGLLAAQYAVVSESFNVSPGGTLTVDVEGADIVVSGAAGSVTVNAKGMQEEWAKWLNISQTADGVLVKFDPDEKIRWKAMKDALVFEISVPTEFNINAVSAGGDITVTSEIRGIVDVKTSGGDIALEGKVSGSVDCMTSGGDIEVADVDGKLSLSTSGGDIEIKNVTGNAEVETSGGDIDVQSVQGELKASTSGGDIEVASVSGDASVETAGGDLMIGTIGGNLDAGTAGGDIEVKAVKGTTDTGTAGGDLYLENLGGEFQAETVGGDVHVSLTGSYPGEMNTIGGKMVLFLPPDAQVTIDADIQFSGNDDDDDVPITSEFGAVNIKRGSVIKSVSSRFDINGGGPVIEISNLSGTIAVKKLP